MLALQGSDGCQAAQAARPGLARARPRACGKDLRITYRLISVTT